MISNPIIDSELSFYKGLLRQAKNALRKLPKGRLSFINQHGKPRPHVTLDGKTTYINRKKYGFMNQLLKREELEMAILRISNNIKILEQIKDSLFDPWDTIPSKLDLPLNRDLDIVMTELERIRSGKPFYENRHVTSLGVDVKSKSEMILMDYFRLKGIIVFYEKALEINGRWYYPDFTLVRKKDGKIFIWEHLGMMSDPKYAEQAYDKIDAYISAGYLPYDNLILTYENQDGGIDLLEIERILRMFEFID